MLLITDFKCTLTGERVNIVEINGEVIALSDTQYLEKQIELEKDQKKSENNCEKSCLPEK
tara:strand:- start:1440 stop:1619 length:180 start_codon:yes stop_codon:yes gene_type:complete